MPAEPRKKRAKRARHPKHETTCRVFSFRLETTPAQGAKLQRYLDLCHEARQILVAQRAADRAANRLRRDAGEETAYLTKDDQYRSLSAFVRADRRFLAVHSQVLQDVAQRIDEGTRRWLESLGKGGRKASPPGPIARKRYRSFTYKQYGTAAHIKAGVLHLSKLGDFRLRSWRRMRGRPKTVIVIWKQSAWWAQVTCELQVQDVYRGAHEVAHLPDEGADPGLRHLLTISDGTVFDPAKPLQASLDQLRRAQRDMRRKFEVRRSLYEAEQARRKAAGEPALGSLKELPYPNRLKAQIHKVARLHTKVENQRRDQQCKVAAHVERRYRLLAVEEHPVAFMAKNRRTARAMADVAPAALKARLRHKLGERFVPTANSRPGIGGNSQTCLCTAPVPKELAERWHECSVCHRSLPRDLMSSRIVKHIAFELSAPGAAATHLGPGQGTVRRGGHKLGRRQPSDRLAARASEWPMSRQPHADPCPAPTTGGEPTVAVNTVVHRQDAAVADMIRKPGRNKAQRRWRLDGDASAFRPRRMSLRHSLF